MTEEAVEPQELEQDKVEHIDKRTSERRDTVYVVLIAAGAGEGDEVAWLELDRVDAADRRQAIVKAHENRAASEERPSTRRYKAVPQSSWKTLEVGEEPQPPKAIVREVD